MLVMDMVEVKDREVLQDLLEQPEILDLLEILDLQDQLVLLAHPDLLELLDLQDQLVLLALRVHKEVQW